MKTTVIWSALKVVLVCAISFLVSTDRAAGESEFNELAELIDRAEALRVAGRAREALPLANHLVAYADGVFRDHPHNLSASLEVAGLIYENLGMYAKAEPLLKRVIAIRVNEYGNEHPDVAMGLNHLALLFAHQGRYAEAELLHLRALAIREKAFGKDSAEVAQSLNNLTNVYGDQGRYAEAEPLLKRALAIYEKASGTEHPLVADCLNNLAYLYFRQGRYAEAEPLHKRALAIREKALGREHPAVAGSLNNLAILYKDQARYAEAEPLLERTALIYEKTLGAAHPRLAMSLDNLAMAYERQGRYAEAEPLLKRGLAIREKSLGANHRDVGDNLTNLAILYNDQARYAEAEPLYKRALAIYEKAFGPDHPSVAVGLLHLASVYHEQRRYVEAEPLYQRSLTISEKALGAEHPTVATILHNLAALNSGQGRPAEAERLYTRSLAIREKVLGLRHPEVAMSLNNLAMLHYAQGHYGQARSLIDRAIEINNLSGASAGGRSTNYLVRARVKWKLDQREDAIADLNQALQLAEQQRTLSSGGEQERAQFFSSFANSYETMIVWQHDLGHPPEVLTTVERSRARSLVDQLAMANIDLLAGVPADEAAALRTRQSTAQTQLAQIEKQIELIVADKKLSEAQREQKIKELEGKLHTARDEVVDSYLAIRNASPVYRQMVGKNFKPAGLADVQTQLVGDDGLLLEYFLGDEAGYVVIIPPTGGKARVETLMVSKEQAAALGVEPGPLTESRMRIILANEAGTGLLQQLRNVSKAEATTDRLAVLWNVLVPKAERTLLVEGKLKRCIVIPDAALAAFPFETLVVEPGEKPKYLLDVGPPIVTAPSATLLMNLMEAKAGDDLAASKKLLSVADPNYGVPSTATVAALADLSARSRYGALHGDLKPLPYTAWECTWVAETFRKAGLDAGVLQKANAREASVRMYAPGRKYLHFACHGLVDQSYGNLFGALALTPGPAGSADPADDGFLTLAEIYELNLRGTELSILSACDTNYGPNQKGEGIWSLSRGFLVAGSKRVVASNWLVDDEAGASLVSVFCGDITKVATSEQPDYAASLQAAKRWVRNQDKWRSPYYWGTFVLVGPN